MICTVPLHALTWIFDFETQAVAELTDAPNGARCLSVARRAPPYPKYWHRPRLRNLYSSDDFAKSIVRTSVRCVTGSIAVSSATA